MTSPDEDKVHQQQLFESILVESGLADRSFSIPPAHRHPLFRLDDAPNAVEFQPGVTIGHGRMADKTHTQGISADMAQLLILLINLGQQMGALSKRPPIVKLQPKFEVDRSVLVELFFGQKASKLGGKENRELSGILNRLSSARVFLEIDLSKCHDETKRWGHKNAPTFKFTETQAMSGRRAIWRYSIDFDDDFLFILDKVGVTHEISMKSIMRCGVDVSKAIWFFLPWRARSATEFSPYVVPLRSLLKDIGHKDYDAPRSIVLRAFRRAGKHSVVADLDGTTHANGAVFHCSIPEKKLDEEDVMVCWFEGSMFPSGEKRIADGAEQIRQTWAEAGGSEADLEALLRAAPQRLSEDMEAAMNKAAVPRSSFYATYCYLAGILGEEFVLNALNEASSTKGVSKPGAWAWRTHLLPAIASKAKYGVIALSPPKKRRR